jgi:hypothetical protein
VVKIHTLDYMYNKFLIILFILTNYTSYGQTANTRSIVNLCSDIGESSGLIWVNGNWVTHNDSGGEPKLLVFDSITGCVTREVVIKNSANLDWEAITLDTDYIYIGDFGNNSGNRTNLKILKIAIADFMTLDSVVPTVINFDYFDQVDFTSAPNNTTWDCEAMVSLDDSLVLISKNWMTNVSSLYTLPKMSGNYSITETSTINTEGKVTDAYLDPVNNQLIIVGYALLPFVTVIENVTSISDLTNVSNRYDYGLQVDNSIQVEGVFIVNNTGYFTSENFSFGGTTLSADFGEILLPIGALNIKEDIGSELKYWQTDSWFHFENEKSAIESIELYDLQGKIISSTDFNSTKGLVLSSGLNYGMFFAKIAYENRKIETIKIWKF